MRGPQADKRAYPLYARGYPGSEVLALSLAIPGASSLADLDLE